ncbi:branched-chain amino acid ABC transporter permease [Simplicispira suum]|uniref:Branched-chain amino acid ABC transporter permease n=1 Tax=Simplicispira suum TaxID=2109915 RepID=A0A2S0N5Y0_9BURK|nr:branched-chain amino acid ABC transporter permease [Simplicispira suum]AVO43516.1 branched-chain amino acid ABC transporter permease [Simplicispira suum]
MDQAVINGLAEGSVYALLALGLVFINRITEIATFAHGEVSAMAAFVGFTVFHSLHAPFAVAILASLAAGAVIGFLVERIVIRPVQTSGTLATVVVTLGLFFVIHGLMKLIWGPEVRPYPSIFGEGTIRIGEVAIAAQNLGVMATAFLIAVGLAAYLRWTRTGLALRAIPQNRFGAALMGLNLRRLTSTAWIVGSCVGAVAGVLIAPLTFLHSNMMQAPLIKAFAVAALGGLNSLVGAFVGGLVLGVIENVTVLYIPTYLKDTIAFLFILLVLLVQPEGLFGKQRKDKV